MPSAEIALVQLHRVSLAWPAIRDGWVPAGDRSQVRVQRIDAPLPINVSILDGRVAVESFVWTYAALLTRHGRQVLERAKCETARSLAWRGRVAVDVAGALVVLERHVRFFLEHPSAPVAWGFATELDALARSTRWAAPSMTKRVSIGVPCHAVECAGIYEIEVTEGDSAVPTATRRKAFGSRVSAICSANPLHVMGATEVDA